MNGNRGPNDSNFLLEILRTDDGRSLSSDALSDVPSEVGSRWSACKGLLSEYAKSTSIRGIRYLFEEHRPIYEKVFWLVALLASLYIGISLSRDTYRKWQDSPVILGFDDTLVPVHEIPFPTVTICMYTSLIDFKPKGYEQLPKFGYEEYLESEASRGFFAARHWCEKTFSLRNVSDLSWEFGSAFKWNGRTYKSEYIYRLFATDEGYCMQFNGMPRSDMYREDSYPHYSLDSMTDFNKYLEDNLTPLNNITGNWSLVDGYVGQGLNAQPQRTIYASIDKGFIGSLDRRRKDEENPHYAHYPYYSHYRFGENGYKIFLNSPDSVLQTSGNFIRVSDGEEVIISVTPQYVRSTDDVRDYEPRKRQCYFNDERYLRFFRQYSRSNCETECLTNFTIAKCGNVQKWMPHPPVVRRCNQLESICYLNAQTELNRILQNQTLQSKHNHSVQIMCDCMPACTSLDYNFEISRAPYDKRKLMGAMREDYPYGKSSVYKVFFKERQFMAIKRTVLFSVTSLIANYGGFCGLLMGISGLSLIELVYFVSLRLCNSLRKRRVSKKKRERKRKKLAMQQILATASSSSH